MRLLVSLFPFSGLFAMAIATHAATDPSSPISAPDALLPAGVITMRDGMTPRQFRLVDDLIVVKPLNEPNALLPLDPPLGSAQALAAYVEAEEQADPYTFIGLLLRPVDLDPEFEIVPDLHYRMVGRRIAVKLIDGARTVEDANLLAAEHGMDHVRERVLEGGWTTFEGASAVDVFKLESLLLGHPSIEDAHIMLGAPKRPRACEDRAFARFFPDDPLYGYQQYLNPPVPIPSFPWDPINPWAIFYNVRPVWENADPFTGLPFLNRPYTGLGVTVGIADDGLHSDHPDLKRNVNRNLNKDWIEDDSDPSGGSHGTRAAGIIGAIGRNMEGLTGIAPRVKLAGLRFFPDKFPDDEIMADVIDYKSASIDILYNGWGPPDPPEITTGPGELVTRELKSNAEVNNRPIIIGAGNGASDDNSNYDGWANSIHTIAVGAINHLGMPAAYSEPGSNILCAGLAAEGDLPNGQLVSTEGASDYIIGSMQETSYAAAGIAAITALMLEARPNLSWRDLQEILIASSPFDGPFNGGVPSPVPGIEDPSYSHPGGKVGFGLVDPAEACRLAEIWPPLPRGANYSKRFRRVIRREPIVRPIINPHVFEFDFSFFEDVRVEHVTLKLKWADPGPDSPGPQPLDMILESSLAPDAIVPIYFDIMSAESTGIALSQEWTFSSVAFWGRPRIGGGAGTWTVYMGVSDPDNRGRIIEEIELTIHGTPVNTPPSIIGGSIASSEDPSVVGPRETTTIYDLGVVGITIEDEDGDEVSVRYQWQELHPDGESWIPVPGAAGTIRPEECDWFPVADFNVEVFDFVTDTTDESLAPRVGQPVTFTDRSVDVSGEIVSWAWDFGDGTTSDLQNPMHTYSDTGFVTVGLTVMDNTGNMSVLTHVLDVHNPTEPLPDPLPVAFPQDPPTQCVIPDGLIGLPATTTGTGTVYRVRMTPFDGLRDGATFTTNPIIVNTEPVRETYVGEDYRYDTALWINSIPPDGFERFARVNEVSQGVLGPDANGEWIEFMVIVECDMRGYHFTNPIASFDVTFTEDELWSVIPYGTILVIYNDEYRDGVLPPDDFDVTDGLLVIGAGNTRFFTLPENGDGWGEGSNTDQAYFAMLDRFCRTIDGVAWNFDDDVETVSIDGVLAPNLGEMRDAEAYYFFSDNTADYEDRSNWLRTAAAANTSPIQPPPPPFPATPPALINPDAEGTTPGAVNNASNQTVRDNAIADMLSSIPRYSLQDPAPAWLAINPATGELTGTPGPGDIGQVTVTVIRSHSFATEMQTFDLIVAAGPALEPLEDEDHDSIINMLEIAFGSDPLVPDSPADVLPSVGFVPAAGGGFHAAIQYRRPIDGTFDFDTQTYEWIDTRGNTFTYVVECSYDMVTWQTAGDLGGVVFQDSVDPLPGVPGVEVSTFRLADTLPGADPTKYMRLSVTRVE